MHMNFISGVLNTFDLLVKTGKLMRRKKANKNFENRIQGKNNKLGESFSNFKRQKR